MFLCVFAGAQRRSGEIAKFQFLIPANWGLLHSASKKTLKVLVMVVFFLVYFAMLHVSLGFELKQNLEAQPYPEMNLKHQKGWNHYGALWEK